MGSIVYIDVEGHVLVGRTRELLLIDGQQRITTFTLIFLILEELARNLGNEELTIKIRNTCLINPYSKLDNKNKLVLTKQDNEVLEKLLRGDDVDNVDSNLLVNYNFLKNKLKNITNEFSLEDIYDNLDRIMVVNVSLSLQGQDNPQQIFESLNATGKALTDADLIRNFILMNLESQLQNKIYLSYWYPMENLLEKNLPFLEFFTYMERGISTNIKDLYKEFKIFLYKEFTNKNGIERLADKLLKYARYYRCLFFSKMIQMKT